MYILESEFFYQLFNYLQSILSLSYRQIQLIHIFLCFLSILFLHFDLDL